jgi:hypothetical protein
VFAAAAELVAVAGGGVVPAGAPTVPRGALGITDSVTVLHALQDGPPFVLFFLFNVEITLSAIVPLDHESKDVIL